MKLQRITIEVRIAIAYLVFGGLWILLSDRLLFWFINDANRLTAIQTYKGWLFVALSALLVYTLLHDHMKARRRLFQELRENEERLRLALDAAKQGIYDLNVQTGEAIVTEAYATMLGYDPASFQETHAKWMERMHPDDVEPVGKIYYAYLAGAIPEYRVEFRQKTASGEWKWLLSLGRTVEFDENGRPLRMLGTHTDITEIKLKTLQIAELLKSLQAAKDDLLKSYDATIEGWSRAMDLRDRETEGHTQRVTQMTVALARRLGICEQEIIHLRRGALLHDIGKMGIPDNILLKPGLLTLEERAIIERHPVYAFEMLHTIAYLQSALDIPRYHHEKWDGTGYPYGYQGERIPLAARLFAIVDVYDALTSDRPYRQAWTGQEAMRYIKDQSGKHFDPQLVPVFFELLYGSDNIPAE